jgi:hypothetical protein
MMILHHVKCRSGDLRIRSRRGFSLAECAISLLLTVVVIVGALQSASLTHRTRTQAQTRWKATELAQLLLTEIMQSYYVDPGSNPTFGSEPGESARSSFNDVDDYNLFNEVFDCKDKSGTSLSGYAGWSRFVVVEWVDPNNPSGSQSFTETGLKRITVTASYFTGENTTLVGLRSSKGIGEPKPATATTYVEWVGANITVGSGSPLTTGTNLINNAQ